MNELIQLERDFSNQSRKLSAMLPQGLDVNRFCRTAVNGICTHQQADRLLLADRQTLFNACQKAAGDGLLLDGREATLVVFRDTKNDREVVTYMPMVQGLIKLARNSGEIRNIVAQVVFEKDRFDYSPGTDAQPLHHPDWFGDRGQPIGAYAVVTTADDEKVVSILRKDRIIAIGRGGRNAEQYQPGTGAHYEEWWKKTVIKNVLKLSPKSTYLQSALDADNALIDPDRIPPVEQDVASALRSRISAVNGQPPARLKDNRPDGEKLAGTYSTDTEPHRDKEIDRAQQLREQLRENKQVAVTKPDDQDRKALQMAVDSLKSCQTLDELKQCGEDLGGMVHPDFTDEVKAAYRQRRSELQNTANA